jgi:Hsp20/alpha crystallin family
VTCCFERRFSLADHMKVMGAGLDNGLLHVDVVREVPEAAKLRTIKIGTTVETAQPQADPDAVSIANRTSLRSGRPRNPALVDRWIRWAQNRTVSWMLFLWTWSQAYDFHP